MWLNSIHKEKYTYILNQAGIDMKMLPYLSVQVAYLLCYYIICILLKLLQLDSVVQIY